MHECTAGKSQFKCVKVLPYFRTLMKVDDIVTFAGMLVKSDYQMVDIYYAAKDHWWTTYISVENFKESFIPV